MSLKRWRERSVAAVLIVAGVYFGGPVILKYMSTLDSWSGEHMGTDITDAQCDRMEREIRTALGKSYLLNSKGQLETEHCTSTRNCTDMKEKYQLMLAKIEKPDFSCSWRDKYEDKLVTVLRELGEH